MAPPRPRAPSARAPRQARSKATVQAIVEATGDVFGAHGFDDTTTSRVAARAGVSVGSLYQYFPDKRALLAAYFEQRVREDVELAQNVAARVTDASPVELLRLTTEEMVALVRRDRALYRSVVEVLPLMEQTAEVKAGLSHAHALATAQLRAHPEILGDRDPELLALLLLHSVRSLLFRVIESAPDKLDDPSLASILVGGVLGMLGLAPDTR